MTTTLSIIIVNWNTQDLLSQCLQSIFDHVTSSPNLHLETIVVDNASQDNSVSIIKENFSWVTLIENQENVGFARANNQGIQASTGEYFLLLNSDTKVEPMAVQWLIETFQNHQNTGAVGPMILNADGSVQNCYGTLPSVFSEILGPYWLDFLTKPWGPFGKYFVKLKNTKPVERVSFACTLTHRRIIEEIGGLDEQYPFYSEDYDWFKRVQDASKLVLLCPQAKVFHYWGASSEKRSQWAEQQLYRSKRRYYKKHFGNWAENSLRIGLFFRFLAKFLLTLLKSPIQKNSTNTSLKRQKILLQDLLLPLETPI